MTIFLLKDNFKTEELENFSDENNSEAEEVRFQTLLLNYCFFEVMESLQAKWHSLFSVTTISTNV